MDAEREGMLPNEDEEKKPLANGAEDVHKFEKDEKEVDPTKVKFINGGADNAAGDARVDIEDSSEKNEFCGLTKEELLKYADDPYWVRVRWILLVLFWLAWIGMLVAAIVIIILAPKCPPRPNLHWWQKSVVHQVYPRSFKDSNGDGVGDLKGIESELEYLHVNNMTAIALSSIYASPQKDFGFDVVDHMRVDPSYGSMTDFESLRQSLHRKGMRLIMDFIPNHVSVKHPWFVESRASKDNEKADYFVWRDTPTNWLSVYGDSAWTFVEERNQYYLHQFDKSEPDLNLRNPQVKAELEAILRFWLSKRVDGFRVRGTAYLLESDTFANEPLSNATTTSTSHDYLKHTETMFQPETYELVAGWRDLLDNYTDPYRALVVEAYGGTAQQVAAFYNISEGAGADLALHGALLSLRGSDCGSACIADQVHSFMDAVPEGYWADWVLGTSDVSRLSSRVANLSRGVTTESLQLLSMLLPGTAVNYYGDEIGMMDNTHIPADRTKDLLNGTLSRDPQRTPMQWDGNAAFAGFSNSTPWLPLQRDWHQANVEVEAAPANTHSVLKRFRALTALRSEPSMRWGSYDHTSAASRAIYGFVRQAYGFNGFLVAVNLDSLAGTADFHSVHPDHVPAAARVRLALLDTLRANTYRQGQMMGLDQIYLEPGEAVVFEWTWDKAPENQ